MRRDSEERSPPTQIERLTEQFYRWELRGRGWQTWPQPVPLEPPFRPFFGHFPVGEPPVDDARKPTWLSSLADILTGRSDTPPPRADAVDEPEPEDFEDEGPLHELVLSVPPDVATHAEAAARFLLALTPTRFPLAYEVIGVRGGISIQVTCRSGDLPFVRRQITAWFPEVTVTERPEHLATVWSRDKEAEVVAVEFGLSREFMVPLTTFSRLDPDPLIAMTGALSEMDPGEVGLLQILFTPCREPWADNVMRAVTDGEGGSFFMDAPELVRQARDKVAAPLFSAVVRLAARSPVPDGAWGIVQGLGGALTQFGTPTGNEFIPLSHDSDIDLETDVLARTTHRSGMILSGDELLALVHLPSVSVRVPVLEREAKRSRPAAAIATGHALVLGENVHRGVTMSVTLGPAERLRHMHVIGASGTGKSTLLLRLIMQDIEQGNGVAVLDPHGDLVEEVLARIPEDRAKDVTLLDPADEEYPVGLNALDAQSELERTLLASDLVAVFRRLSTSWGDQMNAVLANAIQAFLESEQGGTLLDLRHFLVDPGFRDRFLATVRDPEVVHFWRQEFRLLVGRPQGPILTRLDAFLRPKLIRHMVAQRGNRIDFRRLMDGGGILLAKLAQGLIGEENTALLGSLLVARLQQAAMSRQELDASTRRDFFCYIDEFHNFVTPSMTALLAGARKYRVGLVLAHQEMRQVQARDSEVASALLANACTRICFRIGDQDAKTLAEGFSFFGASDLRNLGVGEAIVRIDRAENDFTMTTKPLSAVASERGKASRERIVAHTRAAYARPKAEVEEELAELLTPTSMPKEMIPRRLGVELAPRPIPTVAPAAHAEPAVAAPEAERTVPIASGRPSRVAKPRPSGPSTPGRGGAQHKYLQELIKHWAEEKGYRATIEKQILDGAGSVDVALEQEGFSIACEISVTSTPEQELGNIEKCLHAGFNEIAVVFMDKKRLRKVQALSEEHIGEEEYGRVTFLTPEEFVAFLDAIPAAPRTEEGMVKGYKVRTTYKPLATEQGRARRAAISQVILKAMRRLKGDRV